MSILLTHRAPPQGHLQERSPTRPTAETDDSGCRSTRPWEHPDRSRGCASTPQAVVVQERVRCGTSTLWGSRKFFLNFSFFMPSRPARVRWHAGSALPLCATRPAREMADGLMPGLAYTQATAAKRLTLHHLRPAHWSQRRPLPWPTNPPPGRARRLRTRTRDRPSTLPCARA